MRYIAIESSSTSDSEPEVTPEVSLYMLDRLSHNRGIIGAIIIMGPNSGECKALEHSPNREEKRIIYMSLFYI